MPRHPFLAATLLLAACLRPVSDEVLRAPSVSPRDPAPLAARLGPGDLFEVRVFQEPELTGIYRVGPGGRIDFPFCGEVEVAGATTPDLARRLRDCLSAGYLRDPQVSVTARESVSKKVVVHGHVQKPGAFNFDDDMTIVQAIVAAGGFTPFAAQNRTVVLRSGPGGDQRFEVPVQEIGLGKASPFYLRPGDVVFVPESWK
jgi:protein involved in polysaccharide export with SLBB domain